MTDIELALCFGGLLLGFMAITVQLRALKQDYKFLKSQVEYMGRALANSQERLDRQRYEYIMEKFSKEKEQ